MPQSHSFKFPLPTGLRERRPTEGVAGNPSLGEEGHEAGAPGGRVTGACLA